MTTTAGQRMRVWITPAARTGWWLVRACGGSYHAPVTLLSCRSQRQAAREAAKWARALGCETAPDDTPSCM